jgi:hypothetical protein
MHNYLIRIATHKNKVYPKLSFLVPPQGHICFKSVDNETFQDLILRTIFKGHNNDYFQS